VAIAVENTMRTVVADVAVAELVVGAVPRPTNEARSVVVGVARSIRKPLSVYVPPVFMPATVIVILLKLVTAILEIVTAGEMTQLAGLMRAALTNMAASKVTTTVVGLVATADVTVSSYEVVGPKNEDVTLYVDSVNCGTNGKNVVA
jgi:hypothetical protein